MKYLVYLDICKSLIVKLKRISNIYKKIIFRESMKILTTISGIMMIIVLVGCSDKFDKCDLNEDGKVSLVEKRFCDGPEDPVNCPQDWDNVD